MKRFFISIKKNKEIFCNLNKIEFNLDTSTNIVKQAEEMVSSILSPMDINYSIDSDFAWKVYSHNGNQYMFVSRSRNWVGD